MFWPKKIYTAPPNSGEVILGRTLPSLLDEACDRHSDPHTFNHWTAKGWQSLSNQEFRTAAEELALGLLDLGLEKGDRAGLLMHSDVNFCIADMGCLLAKLINVPVDIAQPPTTIVFILQHAQAKALIVSNLELFHKLVPYLLELPELKTVVVAQVSADWQQKLPQLPTRIQVFSLLEVRARGQAQLSAQQQQQLRSEIAPEDLATIIYIAGPKGKPRGVMLTHENISADILATFSGIPDLEPGVKEVVLSFLPLTHIFARAFLYGHVNYGHSIYFTTPKRVVKDFRKVRPTIFATVPRFLEKVYINILEKGSKLKGLTKIAFNWGVKLAKSYELGQKPADLYARQLKIADKLIFSQWRSPLGGRLKYLISGGAALKADIANFFSAAGITVLQGYGLTETSSVLCCNRGELNRAGTVGVPIAGVEMTIAPDGEILVKAPYIMKGYYKDPKSTHSVIDRQGWFHTGDLGEFTAEGFLKITGGKKNLFKLSTGKYVTPEPLEKKLQKSLLVERAIAVGPQRKFCSMLIFPNHRNLSIQAKAMGIDLPLQELLQHPQIQAEYQKLVEEANQILPSWSRVKRFRLIDSTLTMKNAMLMPIRKLRRTKVFEVFTTVIDSMYGEAEKQIGLLAIVPIFKILYFSYLHKLMVMGIT